MSGFSTIPARYADGSTHYLYARSHLTKGKGKEPEWPDGRTLFVVNLPPDATQREVVLFFKPCGVVESVIFGDDVIDKGDDVEDSEEEEEDEAMEESGGDATDMTNLKLARQRKTRIPTIIPLPLPPQPLRRIRKTGKTAHVVFLDSSALESLSALTKKANPWPISSESPSGLAHYVGLYDALRPPLDAVKKHVDSWMAHFAAIQARPPKSKYKKGEAIVDEDGFTLVTRGGAYGKTLGGGAAVASKKFEMGMESESQSKRKRKKEKRRKEDEDSFYGFKKADKQRKELLDLKARWEQDKATIQKKRAARQFKPY